jgi:hypothetical protein
MRKLYFHVGLAKTGSTYLQNRFFDKLKGVRYIHTSKYFKYPKIIENNIDDNLLFSREFDRQFETEVGKIAGKYPDAYIIVVLRSNEQWIASQYRRYVKNGGSELFEDFIDIKNDKGVWKIKDAEYIHKLEYITKHFKNKPLILIYDDLKKDPHSFFRKIAEYCEADYNEDNVNLKPKHKSYTDKQLLFLRNLTQRFYKKEPYNYKTSDLNWFKVRGRMLKMYIALYLAKILPIKYDKKLIDSDILQIYKEYYIQDWEKCKKYKEDFSAN